MNWEKNVFIEFDIREFKINDATAATTPQNLHT